MIETASSGTDDDVRAIEALVARQFRSLCWPAGGSPDLTAFAADFLDGATLFPARRPAQPQSVQAFSDRMAGLAGGALRSFDEKALWSRITVYGNIATACVACENTENGTESGRNVEMLLLAREAAGWKIAAQAWHPESASAPLGADLPGVHIEATTPLS